MISSEAAKRRKRIPRDQIPSFLCETSCIFKSEIFLSQSCLWKGQTLMPCLVITEDLLFLLMSMIKFLLMTKMSFTSRVYFPCVIALHEFQSLTLVVFNSNQKLEVGISRILSQTLMTTRRREKIKCLDWKQVIWIAHDLLDSSSFFLSCRSPEFRFSVSQLLCSRQSFL
jgi:hypothetical protein